MKKSIVFIAVIIILMMIPTVAFAVEGDYRLTFSADSTEITVGKTTTTRYALITDRKNKVYSVKYSTSDGSIAAVDQNGTVTGVSPGTADISVEVVFDTYSMTGGSCTGTGFVIHSQGESKLSGKSIGVSKSVTITVVPEKELSMDDLTLYQSESGALNVEFDPAYTGSKSGTWSVRDPSVASIDQTGKVTGLTPGETVVWFQLPDSEKVVSASVTVEKLLNLDPVSLSIYAGKSETVTVSYHTRFAGDKSGTWSAADASVATVDQNGTVTGIKAGTTTMTYTNTETGVRVECPVTVKALFTLKPDPVYVKKGMSGYIKVSFDESYTGKKDGTWTIADGSVAAISQSGAVTGKNVGTTVATFTHTATGIKEKCSVIVGSLVFTLSPDPLRIESGTSGSLEVSFDKSYTGDKSGTWSTADASIATVQQDGTVTGKKAGTTTVSFTHTATGTKDECSIIVLQKFVIEPNPLEIEKGATGDLHVNFEEGYTGDKSGVWSIADASVATVDQNGTVTGLKAGTTSAAFTTAATNISKTATIIVTDPVLFTVTFDTNGGSPNPASQSVKKNETIDKPSEPFRYGYAFLGWYTAKDGNVKWDFANDKVTADMMLYAHWAEQYIPVPPPASVANLSLSPATLPGGIEGQAYSATLTASGGVSPYTYSVTSGALPSGLSLNPVTGVISGTPSAYGIYAFTVTAADGGGNTGGGNYTLAVFSIDQVTFTVDLNTTSAVGLLNASDGSGPYTYSLVTPSSLFSVSPGGTIMIIGTLDTVNTYALTVKVTDSAGNSIDINITVSVEDL